MNTSTRESIADANSTREKQRSVGIQLLCNIGLFAITARNTFIIHGDGLGGFGETILKAAIFLICVALLIASSIALNSIERSSSRRPFSVLISNVSTTLFVLFALLAVVDACTDLGGYCRRDGIHLKN